MKVRNLSYPHPVLGNGDDVRGAFGVKFSHALFRDRIVLKPVFSLQNKTLEKLVKQKKAAFSAEAECRHTFYRQAFQTFSDAEAFELDAKKARGQVVVAFYIRAAQDLPKYSIDECHEDYEGFAFDVKKGDVLAVGGLSAFIAEKEFDPLRPAVSSFMAIHEGPFSEGPMDPNFEDDKIVIRLSKKDWNSYVAVKNRSSAHGMLHSAIVMPVLAEAARIVSGQGREQGFDQWHWFERLEEILRRNHLQEEEPLTAAQKILGLPVGRGLAGIETMLNEESGE